MRRIILLCVSIHFFLQLPAQEILKISRKDAEAMFLQNNLFLISEKLNIEQQKAEVIQARLWPNPEFSVSEVNLWATNRQTRGNIVSPPFWNNFGKNQQIAFELNQLIQTAGKRKKLVALAEVDVSKSEQYFEDLLRGLKLELRNQLTELQYIQQAVEIHQRLIQNISTLTAAYKRQLDSGNISKADYVRLKAQELEIQNRILNLHREANEIQKELKLLLRTNATATIEITDDGFVKDTQPYTSFAIHQVIENAKENRPDYKLALLDVDYAHKLLSYEKAQQTPDINFGINYDRNGSTMLDFVGFKLSFDLPFFNRNKGNIKKAQLGIESSSHLKEQTRLVIENEIFLAYQSLQQAIQFLTAIAPGYGNDLDLLLENHTKNFTSKNISMLAYLDFIDAYLENKKIILEAQKEVNKTAEELNYALGQDFQ